MSEYYRRALRQMDFARSEKIRAAQARRDKFYAAHPEMDDLEARIADALHQQVHQCMHDADPDALAADAQVTISRLRREHDARIRALGADPDRFNPEWDCALCCDTGYMTTADGNRAMCDCLRRLASQLAAETREFQPDASKTFASFDLSVFPDTPDPVPGKKYSQRQLMEQVMTLCTKYCDTFAQQEGKNILLCGQSGLGKTYLSHCMANAVAQQGFSVCFVTAYRLSNVMRESYLSEGHAQEAEHAFVSCDFLVIDDLGSEPMRHNIHLESFFSLFNERSIAKKPTLVATNLLPNQLRDRYGERAISRLNGNCERLLLYGSDVRYHR